MSETYKDQSDKQLLTQEMIQFNDGRAGLYFRTPGEVFDWSQLKQTAHIDNLGSPDIALVSTDTGRFAVGSGSIMKLTDFDPKTQTHRKIEQGRRPVIEIEKLSPDGIKPVILGQEWALLQNEGKVQEILVDYTNGTFNDAHQVEAPNPFDDAKDALRSYAEHAIQS